MSPSTTTICSVYLAGVTASVSNDFYEVNLTCAVTGVNEWTLTIVAGSETLVSQLNVYVLATDTAQLAVASKHFVDYAVTQTKEGVQYSYFDPPFGTVSNGYLAGLRSFAIRDNY